MKSSLLVSLTLALATTSITQPVNAAPCSIEAQAASVNNVFVHPAGEEAFSFNLAHLPMEARLSGTNYAELHVKRPLRFTTQHSWNKLGVKVLARTSLLDGRLVLPKDMLIGVAANNHETTRSDIPVTLLLHELRPHEPVLVPCEALKLPRDTPHSREESEQLLPETEIVFAVASKEFSLYAKRKEVAPWRIKFRGALKVVKRSGNWVNVQANWAGGARLQGWAKSDNFSIQRGKAPSNGGTPGSIGMGICGSSHRLAPVSFVLKANAPVHSGPKGAIWAHTAGVIKVKAFSLSRSDGWMQVVRVDGFPKPGCLEHNKIWVHADSVKWTDRPID